MERSSRFGTILVSLMIVLLTFASSSAVSRTSHVCASGSVIKVPQDYATIKDAIEVADDGDTILVARGTYYENGLIVSKTLSLIGENVDSTIIDATIIPEERYGNVFIIQNASGVSISNFTIQNAGYGVFLNYSSGCIVRTNRFGGEFNRILKPIWLEHSNNNRVEGNSIDNGFYGVYMGYCYGNAISENIITSSTYYGVWMALWSNNNVVYDNTVKWNLAGVSLYYFSSSNTIIQNVVTRNGDGIHFLGDGGSNLIIENEISDNGLGMALYGSMSNVIYRNNFLNNTYQIDLDMATNTRWDNDKGVGNFWSDYKGEDLNGDRIGDTLLPHLEVDMHPMIELSKRLQGDVDGNGLVDRQDLYWAAIAFGSQPENPIWDADADLTGDNLVDIFDIVLIGTNYGKKTD